MHAHPQGAVHTGQRCSKVTLMSFKHLTAVQANQPCTWSTICSGVFTNEFYKMSFNLYLFEHWWLKGSSTMNLSCFQFDLFVPC